MLCVASSTGGKTVSRQNLILKTHRGSFERIYSFSPSVHVYDTWQLVKKYRTDVMKVDTEREPVYDEEYDPAALKEDNGHPAYGSRFPEEEQTKGLA